MAKRAARDARAGLCTAFSQNQRHLPLVSVILRQQREEIVTLDVNNAIAEHYVRGHECG